jgi:hypothetical protein
MVIELKNVLRDGQTIGIKKNHLFVLLNSIRVANHQIEDYLTECLKKTKYCDDKSPINGLNFNNYGNFLVISVVDMTDCLRHVDPMMDRVMHQSRVAVFEQNKPLFYLEKPIKMQNSSGEKNIMINFENENSYLKNNVYDKLLEKSIDIKNDDFDQNIISVYKNYIGSYLVLFYCDTDGKWYFLFSNIVYELTANNHMILHDHLKDHLDKLNKNYCYHMILVDSRIRKLITPVCVKNYIVLVKMTKKYTLEESYDNPYSFFTTNKRIYMSCMDDIELCLHELDSKNVRAKRMLHRGFLMKVKIDDCDDILIPFDTATYKKLIQMIPKGMTIHGVHLKLYQNDKLNYFLQYIDDSYTDIVKRINESMSTMSREILDIYHLTRKKKNSEFYKLLPQSYRQILYQLHSNYIVQKNNYDKKNIGGTNNNDKCEFDDRIAITVDDVYTKLKDLDTELLIDLYKDRDHFAEKYSSYIKDHMLEETNTMSLIKLCTSTKIQTKLLSL